MTEVDQLRNALAWALATGQYIERRKGGPASRRYECGVASCRARGPSPSVLQHSPKCEYWRSLLLLRGQASGAGEQLQAARWADAVRPRDDRSLAGAVSPNETSSNAVGVSRGTRPRRRTSGRADAAATLLRIVQGD